jgi:hypothetical protein
LLCNQVALSVLVKMHRVVVVRLDQGHRDFPGNSNSCQSIDTEVGRGSCFTRRMAGNNGEWGMGNGE